LTVHIPKAADPGTGHTFHWLLYTRSFKRESVSSQQQCKQNVLFTKACTVLFSFHWAVEIWPSNIS